MADRVDVAQDLVLLRIRAKLKAFFALPDAAILETTEPLAKPDSAPSGDLFFQIAMGDGQFPFEEQCAAQCFESTEFTVAMFVRLTLDRSGHEAELLRGDGRGGLLRRKRLLLKCFVGADLLTAEPTDVPPGVPFLRSLIYAKSATRAAYDPGEKLGWLSITFGLEFDWDLTS
jgi:hypothetical protein